MHHAGNVAIGNQTDRGACLADLGNHRLVAGTFQNANGDVRGGAALGGSQGFHPLTGRHVQGDDAFRIARTNGQLVHIGVRCVQHRSAWPHGNHCQCVGHVFGGQRGAFQWIKRDIDARTIAGSHFFADVQHRRFVALAFANHHHTFDVEQVQLFAHGVHCRLVGGFFVATPDQRGRGQGGLFGDSGQAQRQHAVVEGGIRGGHTQYPV